MTGTDSPTWLSCSRCGATARRVDEFLAHVREVHGAWDVVEVPAVAVQVDVARSAPANSQSATPQKSAKKSSARAERWITARDRYPDASLQEIADAESVTRSAVCRWRKAAVAAGIEREQDWRARGRQIAAARRPKQEQATRPKEKRQKRTSGQRARTSTPLPPTKGEKAGQALAAVESGLAVAEVERVIPAPRVLSSTEAVVAVKARLAERAAAKVAVSTRELPAVSSSPAPRAPAAIPRLQLSADQAAIARCLFDGRILLTHLDEGWYRWADAAKGERLPARVVAELVERGLVAQYGFETSARLRRLMLTEKGRVVAGQVVLEREMEAAVAQQPYEPAAPL